MDSYIGQIAVKHFKKVSLELGGNSALIILDDADIDYAVNELYSVVLLTKARSVCQLIALLLLEKYITNLPKNM